MTRGSELHEVQARFWPHLFEADQVTLEADLEEWARSGLVVRTVAGHRMRTLSGVFDEFSLALQFPGYFGRNKDAFDECIAELEDLPPGNGYVVVVTQPDEVLSSAEPADFRWLVQSLESAACEWARPVEQGESWDRSAVPFHLVLAGVGDALSRAARVWATYGPTPVRMT